MGEVLEDRNHAIPVEYGVSFVRIYAFFEGLIWFEIEKRTRVAGYYSADVHYGEPECQAREYGLQAIPTATKAE